jgi:hypothetical protein
MILTNYATIQKHTIGPAQVPPRNCLRHVLGPGAPHTCAPSKATHASSHAHKQALPAEAVAAREGLVHMGL